MSDLSVLCVTGGESYSWPFVAELEELADYLDATFVEFDGAEAGYLEAVLDDAVAACPDGYVLRLDDDERPSEPMREWLAHRHYRLADHWAFPRANLYPDAEHRLAGTIDGFSAGGSLWPDLQTRLSVKSKSGGRHRIHTGSPYGVGAIAPVAIEHHKLLVRTLAERKAQAERYEKIALGAGRSRRFGPFQTPELFDPFVSFVPYHEEALVSR